MCPAIVNIVDKMDEKNPALNLRWALSTTESPMN